MPPSLLNLCLDSLKLEILQGDNEDLIETVYELPTDLFDSLLNRLPALPLHLLHLHLPHAKFLDDDDDILVVDRLVDGRKRVRCQKFNLMWMELFISRWPDIHGQFKECLVSEKDQGVKFEGMIDWQQKYWQTHLQCCLDAAAEKAMLPYFGNCLADIRIPDKLLKCIGYEGQIYDSTCDYSKLLGHCKQFGSYARTLRLQNVHCTLEISHLLRDSKLESLVIRKLNTKTQVDGLCKILMENIDTIRSLEFFDCKLSSDFIDAIYDSLHPKKTNMQGLEEFAIRASKLFEATPTSSPTRLFSLVMSGRSLTRFSLCDNQISRNLTSLFMKSILDASFGLPCHDPSENSISDCLHGLLPNQPSSLVDIGNSLQSLQVLNLRGNNLTKNDIKDLKTALIHMPRLGTLDLGDNPLGDDIIRCLIPIFMKTSKSAPLANLYLNNCRLTVDGATDLLEVLSDSNYPLQCLSLADNNLGSKVAIPLAKLLGTPIKTLHIGEIGFGSDGFLELERSMGDMATNIARINIRANRGGIEAANFVARLLRCAPELVSVVAAYNILPQESLMIIYSSLKVTKGKFQHLDLTGNQKLWPLCHSPDLVSKFGEFRYNGKPIVAMPEANVLDASYDDDL